MVTTPAASRDRGPALPPTAAGTAPYGPLRPGRTILGMEFAGEVEAIGKDVTLFRPGDRVFGMVRYREVGANADYVCVMEDGYIATMPEGLPFEQAVVCEGAFYAQACLAKLNLKPGDRVLVYGASGAIGTAAVQLAKSIVARVTAVVGSRSVSQRPCTLPGEPLRYR